MNPKGAWMSKIVLRAALAAAVVAAALKFFDWAFAHGAKQAEALDDIPMPANVVGMIKKKWAAMITGPNGKPVYAGV